MDKEISKAETQYIICECGDNFPNERFLNIHLANEHGDVEAFQCDACAELFTSANALNRHMYTHKAGQTETHKKHMKTYGRKTPLKQPKKEDVHLEKMPEIAPLDTKPPETTPLEKKPEKKPPLIKLKSLKRIDSISLIKNLTTFGGFIKLEPKAPKPEPLPEPEPDPQPPEDLEVPAIELEELPDPANEPEDGQVFVKTEREAESAEVKEEIYYQCDVCNLIFYTEWDFNVHYQSVHALKLEPPATAEQILERHLVTDHADDEGVQAGAGAEAEVETGFYFECELCHKIFASEKYFNIHYNKAHGGLPVIVETADEEQESNPGQDQAEAAKPKAPEQVIYYKCDLCKILYPSEKAYNLHFDKKHGGQSCQEVQSGFRFIEQELTEDLDYSPPPAEEFTCEYCPKTFTMKRSLQIHRKRVHLSELQAEQVGEPARPASRSKVCDVCGRAYNSNAALRYHQRRHTGEKPYACTMCPKRFTMPMFLQIHIRTHTGEKPYECPHCPKAFTNKAALIRHDRIHTGLRPYKCETCGKGFISKAMLNRHVRVHTGVKPYACPECGKMFTQSNSMKLHVSTVHLKLPAPYKSKSRRSKSEARALQLALKYQATEELVLRE